MKNYYNILGVPEDASAKAINEAYKKLAQKFHPDKNPDDEFFASWFKEINEANRVLGDEDERADYDFKLSNYAEAYEILRNQQAEEKAERSHRRSKFLRAKARRKKWWMAGTFAAIIAITFFMLKDNDTKAFANDEPGNTSLKVQHVIQRSTNQKPIEASHETVVANVNSSSQTTSFPTITNSVEGKKEKTSIKTFKGTSLTKQQTADIISKLKDAHQVNCVQILQTASSKIKKDFAIAQVLKKNGYIIAGREIIKANYSGINVLVDGNLAKVIIGSM